MRLIVIIVLFFCSQTAFLQDSTFIKLMSDNTYEFEVIDGELVGEGAEFLKEEYKQSQYILIGEYHFSPQISNFTTATIRTIDQYGFKTIALEIGEKAINYLIEGIENNSDGNVYRGLADYHNKYSYLDEDKDLVTTIPFLEIKEDADFFNEAISKNWTVFGLDQEYMHSFVPAMDLLFENLSDSEKAITKDLKDLVKDSIRLQEIRMDNLFEKMKNNLDFHKYLKAVSTNDENIAFVEDIYTSLEIYSLAYLEYKYYKAFVTRLRHFKTQLSKQMMQHNFDLKNDKMLLKYGGLHTAKGTSTFDCFDIGNTLNELAEFNGNKSLHLYFRSRLKKTEEGIEDSGNDEKDKYYELLKFGKADKWIAIDLRPARDQSIFYPNAYNLNEYFYRLIINQDILIIPSTDYIGDPIK